MSTRVRTGRWYLCRGCGQPCALMDGGRMVHWKATPEGPVTCNLCHECNSDREFYERVAGKPTDPPPNFKVIKSTPDRSLN